MVIADSVAAAKEGMEAIEVDYETLPAVADTASAARPDAPKLFDEARSNVCLDAECGEKEATAAAFAEAAHIVRFETWIPRITGVPLEPTRRAIARNPLVTHPITDAEIASQQQIADRFHRIGVIPNAIRVADQVWRPTA